MSESNWYIYYSGRYSFKNYASNLIRKFNPSIPEEDIMGPTSKNYKVCIKDVNTGESIDAMEQISIKDWFKPLLEKFDNDPSKTDDIHKPSRYLASDGSEVKDLIAKATEELYGEMAFYTGCMIKYACRWSKAGGKKDLYKIAEYAHMLIHLIINDPSILTWSNEEHSEQEVNVNNECYPWVKDFIKDKNLSYDQTVLAIRILHNSACWWARGSVFDGFYCAQKLVDITIDVSKLIETL